MGDKKYRNKGGDDVQVMTLKKAVIFLFNIV
jgi:hypothetical protein